MDKRFTNQFSTSKTLKFELRPQGETERWIVAKSVLLHDEKRDNDYTLVKKLVDELHREFIAQSLPSTIALRWDELHRTLNALQNLKKDDPNKPTIKKELSELESGLRKQIADLFIKNKDFFAVYEQALRPTDQPTEDHTEGDTTLNFKSLFSEKIFSQILTPKYQPYPDEAESLKTFHKFSSYFVGFHDNRANIYTSDDIPTAIAHRIVHVNFRKYDDNIKALKKIKQIKGDHPSLIDWIASHPQKIKKDIFAIFQSADIQQSSVKDLVGEVFNTYTLVKHYNRCLNQRGIDEYNERIGAFNLVLNLYRQENQLDRRSVPNLTELYKQILSPKTKDPRDKEPFENDLQLKQAVDRFYIDSVTHVENASKEKVNVIDQLAHLLTGVCAGDYNDEKDKIILRNDKLTEVSQHIFGDWGFIGSAIYQWAEAKYPLNKKGERTKKDLANIKRETKANFALDELDSIVQQYIQGLDKGHDILHNAKRKVFVQSQTPITEYFKNPHTIEVMPAIKDNNGIILKSAVNIPSFFAIKEEIPRLFSAYLLATKSIQEGDTQLFANTEEIEKKVVAIKQFLDAFKTILDFLKPLTRQGDKGEGDEENYNVSFYNDFETYYHAIADAWIPLYNKCRNYITRKPYSEAKYKLTFENPTLANGWDKNKETENTTVLLMKGGKYYLAIMDKTHKGNNLLFEHTRPVADTQHAYEKIIYKLLPGPNKMLPKVFFSKSWIEKNGVDEKIWDAYKAGKHKKGDTFSLTDCHAIIDYFKKNIALHPDWKHFDFKFSPTKSYKDISKFYYEVASMGYKLSKEYVAAADIDQWVSEGKLFLFEIYNKDFSPHTHGKKNLHTLYWEALFSPQNLADVVYKLNGEAELFYRPSSIKNPYKHRAGEWVANKIDPKTGTPLAEDDRRSYEKKQNKTFARKLDYDIVKDRRFTQDKYFFHVPITIYFKANGKDNINAEVNDWLKGNDTVKFIGVDRGEKNLLYVSLIEADARIVAQESLNEITVINDDKIRKTDYHQLLDVKETERKIARVEWKGTGNIKNLKNGYLSLAVNQIVKMMVKENAILIMENLNVGMKRGRQKIEKQIYQKFEKMLIDKLNCYVDKDKPAGELGSVLQPLQLTSKASNADNLGNQSGMVFYVPAAYTSKIDYATGFVPLYYFKHERIEQSKSIVANAIERISFSPEKIAWEIDYAQLDIKSAPKKTRWTLSVVKGQGRAEYDTKERKNKVIDVYEILAKLWKEKGIAYGDDIKEAWLDTADAYGCAVLFKYFNLISQMRFTIEEEDFILSPIANEQGGYFRTDLKAKTEKPRDADANGAYHIALKGVLLKRKIEAMKEGEKKLPTITNEEWFDFVQSRWKG